VNSTAHKRDGVQIRHKMRRQGERSSFISVIQAWNNQRPIFFFYLNDGEFF
jgi:hypothetical protein